MTVLIDGHLDIGVAPRSAQEAALPHVKRWACRNPERPLDYGGSVGFHDGCSGCLIAAEAGVLRGDVLPAMADGRGLLDHMRRFLAEHGPAPEDP